MTTQSDPIREALRALETAAQAEVIAKQELDRTEAALTAGTATRGDLADAYETWLDKMGNKQRAELALARQHARHT